MKRILIVKLWALGDILMATPLLTALKRQWPDSSIVWVADQEYADILQDNPLLDHVIAFDSGTWRKHFRYGKVFAYFAMSGRLRRDLKRLKPDIVINLTAEKWWSIWFNVAPVRIGLFPRINPGQVGRLYTTAIPRVNKEVIHNTAHYLRPAGALNIPGPYDERLVLGISPQGQEDVQSFLTEQSNYDPAKPVVVVHPGASQQSKCWPSKNFAALVGLLGSRYNVVITGSPKEAALAHEIEGLAPAGSRFIVAAGTLNNLRQTIALVDRAAGVVTGDTSILHIASALETPLVGIYGSTRPNDNAPQFGPRTLLFDDSVPCAPCYKAHCPLRGDEHLRCQRAISPEAVAAALNTLLEENHEPSPTR